MAEERATEARNQPATITQVTLDWLNTCRLLVEPLRDLSPETNEKDAEIRTQQFVVGMTLEQKFLFYRRMVAISSTASLLLKRDKLVIENELKRRDERKLAEAVASRKAENRPKKEKKQLSDREKAIATLLKVGLSQLDAEASVDKTFRAQGKCVQ